MNFDSPSRNRGARAVTSKRTRACVGPAGIRLRTCPVVPAFTSPGGRGGAARGTITAADDPTLHAAFPLWGGVCRGRFLFPALLGIGIQPRGRALNERQEAREAKYLLSCRQGAIGLTEATHTAKLSPYLLQRRRGRLVLPWRGRPKVQPF